MKKATATTMPMRATHKVEAIQYRSFIFYYSTTYKNMMPKFTWNQVCKTTEYREGTKCSPKKSLGESVGFTKGWKCKSGKEVRGTCTGPKVSHHHGQSVLL